MRLIIHFDGGCSTAKGIAAGAAVLYDEQGNELATRTQFLERVTTPVAEYTALHLGLALAAEYAGAEVGQTHVLALGDAELIVRHVDGRYRCTKPHLQAMLAMVKLLMRPFASCEVREFPKAGPQNKRRWGNERADQLASECMEAGAR